MSSREFLSVFMRFALDVTKAERGLAVDEALQALDFANLEAATVNTANFQTLLRASLQEALSNQQAVITNNIITDPSEAPITNTNFSDLRVIVVMPIGKIGAVYLDQHIRQGVIGREVIDRLSAFAESLLAAGETQWSLEALKTRYESANAS